MHLRVWDHDVFGELTFDDCFDFIWTRGKKSSEKMNMGSSAMENKPIKDELPTLFKKLMDHLTMLYKFIRISENS